MAKKKTKKPDPNKLPAQIVGNIGQFYVCYELSRRGLNAVPTSRNTKAVDVIVGTADFSKHKTIQVKTTSANMGTQVGKTTTEVEREETIKKTKIADFWVFVNLDKKQRYEAVEVAVCEGGDEELFYWGTKDLWWAPWDDSRPETRAKWDKQKNDDGWKLIVDSLK